MKSIIDATEVEKGSEDACANDQSTPWIETVLNTLNQRPDSDRQALLQALMRGDETVAGDGAVSGLTSTPTEIRAKPTHRSGSLARSPAPHPVSGTSFRSETALKSSKNRKKAGVLGPRSSADGCPSLPASGQFGGPLWGPFCKRKFEAPTWRWQC